MLIRREKFVSYDKRNWNAWENSLISTQWKIPQIFCCSAKGNNSNQKTRVFSSNLRRWCLRDCFTMQSIINETFLFADNSLIYLKNDLDAMLKSNNFKYFANSLPQRSQTWSLLLLNVGRRCLINIYSQTFASRLNRAELFASCNRLHWVAGR